MAEVQVLQEQKPAVHVRSTPASMLATAQPSTYKDFSCQTASAAVFSRCKAQAYCDIASTGHDGLPGASQAGTPASSVHGSIHSVPPQTIMPGAKYITTIL
jgi:hypothetical protein